MSLAARRRVWFHEQQRGFFMAEPFNASIFDVLPLPAQFDPVAYKPQASALHRLICPCGPGAECALEVLREYLAVFSDSTAEFGYPYLNLAAHSAFVGRHGDGVAHLLANLLEVLGLVDHTGSLNSSASLTDAGEGLRDLLGRSWFITLAYGE